MTKYLGLDLSTQKLKAVVLDENLKLLHESEVDFDTQLSEFRTQGGVIKGEKGAVSAPVILWVQALDLIFDQMKLEGVNFAEIKAISGAAQQHGSVYWQKGSREILNKLDSIRFLYQQLQGCFTIKNSPVWMDSSTTKYCKNIEEAVGGAEKLAEITGSRAYERFTASQIAKIADTRQTAFENCERISLISNFICSLLLGDYAEVDFADASGMNLMNIKTKEWDEDCIQALKAGNIRDKLGKPVPPHTKLGPIADYFVQRFGFNPDCEIVSFTGDNAASFAGMRLSENDMIISLGTSDTVMMSLKEPKSYLNGHVLCCATNEASYLGMLCFKNGSLTRERLKKTYANGSWEDFEKLLNSTPRGNFGNMGLYFDNREILPFVKPGDYRWNSEGKTVTKFAADEIEVRALIEGQILARRAFAEDMGLKSGEKTKIVATGGASKNRAILQVVADVFNAPVYTQSCSNSAALGAAYLAKVAVEPDVKFEDIKQQIPDTVLACEPNRDAVQIYDPMLKKYRILVSGLITDTED